MLLSSSIKTQVFLLLTSLFYNVLCQHHESNLCVTKCLCLTTEGVVACHKNDQIRALPTNIDTSITRLIIQNGKFDQPTLFSYNLTGLEHLTFLKIIYYNLEIIASRAFYRMKHLQYLDLSHNRLLKVLDYAFSGLSLTHLHLMENINIQFEPRAFTSMQSTTINLRSNNLTTIEFDYFRHTKVEILYLYNNSITRIDPEFQQLFNTTNTLLDLSNNPLVCDCSLSWLAELLSMHISKDKSFIISKKINITCNKPDNLLNRELMFLRPEDLNCFQLKIEEIKINISSESYQITCVSRVGGFKAPVVTWKHYVSEYNKYTIAGFRTHKKILEDEFRVNTLSTNTITILPSRFQQDFIKLLCIASVDDNLIQTLEVKLNRFSTAIATAKYNESFNVEDVSKEADYWLKKNFTLLEMISAVFGTFCATFVCLILILRYLKTYQSKIMKKENENERAKHSNIIKPYWYASNGHSSTYSVPNSNLEYELPVSIIPQNEMIPIYSHPPKNQMEFIDYKTHNPIIK